MLNKNPIFIVSFAYGGSNILLNLLRSHPEVCSPRGELNEVFKGRREEPSSTRLAKKLRYFPCVIAEGRDVFGFNDWDPRRPFKVFTHRIVDRILFDEKLRAINPSQNFYKYEDAKYTKEEIKISRLLSKNLDGLTFVTPELARMYPDAVFFGLVRNGFAICEGHARRGYDLETIAKNYEKGCLLMLEHSQAISNYHIVRYEDMIASPLETLKKIYRLAGLDIAQVKKIRLQDKRVVEKDGSHPVVHQAEWKKMIWYDLDELDKHFRRDANENQIRRLTEEQKSLILKHCSASLEKFGYLPAGAKIL